MEIVAGEEAGVIILGFSGRLDAMTSDRAEETLVAVVEKGESRVLLDLEHLEYISSAGLRVILSAAKGLSSSGGELRLCSLNETVQEVFDMSGFSMILQVFASRSLAMEGF